MVANTVGEVKVDVNLDAKSLPTQLRTALRALRNDPTVKTEMKRVGTEFQKQFNKGFDGSKMGKKAAKDFSKGFNKNVKLNKQTVRVDYDASRVKKVAQDAGRNWNRTFAKFFLRSGSGGLFAGITSFIGYSIQLFGLVGKGLKGFGEGFQEAGESLKTFNKFGKVAGTALAGIGRGIALLGSNPVTIIIGLTVALSTLATAVVLLSPLINGIVGSLVALVGAAFNAGAALITLVPIGLALAGALGAAFFAAKDAFGAVSLLNTAISSGAAEDWEKYNEALAGLGPNAKEAVQAFEPLLRAFQGVQDAAEEAFFEGFAESLATTTPLLTIVKDSFVTLSGVMGDVVENFLRLGENPTFVASFQALADSSERIVASIGSGLLGFFSGLTNIFATIAGPAERVASAIARAGESFNTWSESEENRQGVLDFFNGAVDIGGKVWDIIYRIGQIIGLVFGPQGAQEPLLETDGILDSIIGELDNIVEWLKDPENQKKLQDWFREAWRIATLLWAMMKAILKEFQKWNTPENRDLLRRVIEGFTTWSIFAMRVAAALARISDWLSQFTLGNLTKSALPTFVRLLQAASDALNFIVNANPPAWISGLGGLSGLVPLLSAKGGVFTKPTLTWVGEDGPEAIVPMNRSLGRVDPAVRDISAMVQGLRPPKQVASGGVGVGGAGMTVTQNITPQQADPEAVAASVMNRLLVQVR